MIRNKLVLIAFALAMALILIPTFVLAGNTTVYYSTPDYTVYYSNAIPRTVYPTYYYPSYNYPNYVPTYYPTYNYPVYNYPVYNYPLYQYPSYIPSYPVYNSNYRQVYAPIYKTAIAYPATVYGGSSPYAAYVSVSVKPK